MGWSWFQYKHRTRCGNHVKLLERSELHVDWLVPTRVQPLMITKLRVDELFGRRGGSSTLIATLHGLLGFTSKFRVFSSKEMK
jgi:hypothetical protein